VSRGELLREEDKEMVLEGDGVVEGQLLGEYKVEKVELRLEDADEQGEEEGLKDGLWVEVGLWLTTEVPPMDAEMEELVVKMPLTDTVGDTERENERLGDCVGEGVDVRNMVEEEEKEREVDVVMEFVKEIERRVVMESLPDCEVLGEGCERVGKDVDEGEAEVEREMEGEGEIEEVVGPVIDRVKMGVSETERVDELDPDQNPEEPEGVKDEDREPVKVEELVEEVVMVAVGEALEQMETDLMELALKEVVVEIERLVLGEGKAREGDVEVVRVAVPSSLVAEGEIVGVKEPVEVIVTGDRDVVTVLVELREKVPQVEVEGDLVGESELLYVAVRVEDMDCEGVRIGVEETLRESLSEGDNELVGEEEEVKVFETVEVVVRDGRGDLETVLVIEGEEEKLGESDGDGEEQDEGEIVDETDELELLREDLEKDGEAVEETHAFGEMETLGEAESERSKEEDLQEVADIIEDVDIRGEELNDGTREKDPQDVEDMEDPCVILEEKEREAVVELVWERDEVLLWEAVGKELREEDPVDDGDRAFPTVWELVDDCVEVTVDVEDPELVDVCVMDTVDVEDAELVLHELRETVELGVNVTLTVMEGVTELDKDK